MSHHTVSFSVFTRNIARMDVVEYDASGACQGVQWCRLHECQ